MTTNENWKKAGVGLVTAAGLEVGSKILAVDAATQIADAQANVPVQPSDPHFAQDLLHNIHGGTIAEAVTAGALGLGAFGAFIYSIIHGAKATFGKDDSMGSANIAGASAAPVAQNAATHNQAQEAAQNAAISKEAVLNK